MGDFTDQKQKSSERWQNEVFLIFFFIGASATKSWEKSRIYRYSLPLHLLSKEQKTTAGENRVKGESQQKNITLELTRCNRALM